MKFFIKKLGCPKNDVDGDYIAGKLIESGHEYTKNETAAEAVIVNTCGFILPAKEESIEEILRYESLKGTKGLKRLYITGCLSQRYGEELLKRIKAIDGVFGLGKIDELVEALNSNSPGPPALCKDDFRNLNYIGSFPRFVEDKYSYEYIKISDGCNRFCSYCSIPFIRGTYRSRQINDIIEEVKLLVDRGKKELILVSQEGTAYGRDLGNGVDIIRLSMALEKINSVEWIRLMYLHPESVSDGLIEYLSTSKKALGYFDIPLQHINDRVLSFMNRKITRTDIENTLSKIRLASSQNIIRTTFIVGFPGETEEEFIELKDFIEDFKFDRLGIFKYSQEEGTKSAEYDNQIPEDVKDRRLDDLMMLQQEIAFEKNIALIDTIQKVIIDDIDTDGMACGRTIGDCPEIDQMVYIKNRHVTKGDIVNVRVIMTEGYDLIARIDDRQI